LPIGLLRLVIDVILVGGRPHDLSRCLFTGLLGTEAVLRFTHSQKLLGPDFDPSFLPRRLTGFVSRNVIVNETLCRVSQFLLGKISGSNVVISHRLGQISGGPFVASSLCFLDLL
jgi:hypothetical protein